MQIIRSVDTLKQLIRTWKQQGDTIGFVPTMGNLHAGHLSGVEQAQQQADKSVVSIYVNPLQFNQSKDFTTYPRTLETDQQKLIAQGADCLFIPSTDVIYPRPLETMTRVEVPGYSDILCGQFRPGHFVGVATIVTKLINIVGPDVLVLGNKDYQQQFVIRRMVEDLSLSVKIAGLPTVREDDGLAMSSRNRLLSQKERQTAPMIYRILQQTAQQLKAGQVNYSELEQTGLDWLHESGFNTDYLSIRHQHDLTEPQQPVDYTQLVVLAAATLGQTRLIDNIIL